MCAYSPGDQASVPATIAEFVSVESRIGASDLGKHFSRFPASKGFPSLMAG